MSFFRVSICAFAKEMWDILEDFHGGTIDVKNNKDKNQPSNRYNTKNVNEFNSTNYTFLDVVNRDTSRLKVQAM